MRITMSLALAGMILCGVSSADSNKSPDAEEQPKAVPTAWGKPVIGLQAGIRMKAKNSSPDEAIELLVVIRNVGKKSVAYGRELAPASFWGVSEEGVVPARAAYAYGGFAQPGVRYSRELKPGAEEVVGTMSVLRVRAGLERFPFKRAEGERKTLLSAGQYRVGVDGVEVWTGEGHKLELGTGYLDVEIRGEPKK